MTPIRMSFSRFSNGLGRAFCLAILLLAFAPRSLHAGEGVWTCGGPYGGYVNLLAIVPQNTATLYAVTYDGLLYKSTDAGMTWGDIVVGDGYSQVNAIVIGPKSEGTAYAASGSTLYRTTDGGATWSQTTNDPNFYSITTLAIDPQTPQVLYAASYWNGILKSTDAGVTWLASTGAEGSRITVIALDPSDLNTIYAGDYNNGLYTSADGGVTFERTNMPYVAVGSIAVDPLDGTLYVGTAAGLLESSDGGNTWTTINNNIPELVVGILGMDPQNPSTLYAGTLVGFYKSTNRGASWMRLAPRQDLAGPGPLAIDPLGSGVMYVCAGSGPRGIYKSTDGGNSWAYSSTGLADVQIQTIAFVPSNPELLFAGTEGAGFFKSVDGGASWSVATTDPELVWVDTIAISSQDPLTMYAGSPAGVFKSIDGGSTWAPTSEYAPQVEFLVIDSLTPTTLYAGGWSGVLKSVDAGVTWNDINTGFPTNVDLTISGFAIDPSNPLTLFASLYKTGQVFKTTNGGTTWQLSCTGLPAATNWDGEWFTFAISPVLPTTIYVGSSYGGAFKSTDGGTTWSEADNGLDTWEGVGSLCVHPLSPNLVYASVGWGGGVYQSIDGGASWTPLNNGLEGANPWALALNPGPLSTLYAGTSHGVFSFTPACTAPVVINGVSKSTNPFRIKMTGSNFHTDCILLIDGTPVPLDYWVRKSDSLIVVKGKAFKHIPKGTAITITVYNPDDGCAGGTFIFTR